LWLSTKAVLAAAIEMENGLADRKVKVSVVIPTYQEGKYIADLLSRLAIVNDPMEIIVVDGGSTDETIKVAQQFTDKVYQIDHRGIARARNCGARLSSGEIIVFLDADVVPPPDFVERTVTAFRDTGAVGATCNIMPSGPRIPELVFFTFYNRLIRSLARLKPHSRGEFLALRRTPFLRVGGFDEDLACIEDHDLAFRVSKLGRFIFISDLTVHESMRRIRKMGLANVLRTWIVNYVTFVLCGKTVSTVWKPIR